MFFEEYLKYEMTAMYNYKDIARKRLLRVIFVLLVHLRVKLYSSGTVGFCDSELWDPAAEHH